MGPDMGSDEGSDIGSEPMMRQLKQKHVITRKRLVEGPSWKSSGEFVVMRAGERILKMSF